MNAETQIRDALRKIMTDGEANACRIWKGYDVGTGETGWHVQKFGQNATWYGDNLASVLESINDIATERVEVG